MWDSGRENHPAGCEVSREALQQESSPRIVVGKKPLTEKASCEAGQMTAPDQCHCVNLSLQRGSHPQRTFAKAPSEFRNVLGWPILSLRQAGTGLFRPRVAVFENDSGLIYFMSTFVHFCRNDSLTPACNRRRCPSEFPASARACLRCGEQIHSDVVHISLDL
jgi:hypothetical protein